MRARIVFGRLHVKAGCLSIKSRNPSKCTDSDEPCPAPATNVTRRVFPTRLACTWRNFTGFIEKRFTNCFGAELLTFLPTAAHAEVTPAGKRSVRSRYSRPHRSPRAGGDHRLKTNAVYLFPECELKKKKTQFVRTKKSIVLFGILFDIERHVVADASLVGGGK